MAGISLTTAGVTISYAVEATAGTKPTAFTNILGAMSIPEFNPEPKTYETTTLDALVYTTYVQGLKDIGGALAFKFGFTEVFKAAWKAIVTASTTAAAASKATWFQIIIPGIAESFYICGTPSDLGLPAMEVGNVISTTVYITPSAIKGWDVKIVGT